MTGDAAGQISGEQRFADNMMSSISIRNAIAEMVWELLGDTLTLPEIAAAVSTEFGLSRERALADTRELNEFFSKVDYVTAGRGLSSL